MGRAVEGDLGRQFTTGAKVAGVPTAGKSGTAELGGTGEPHSWFIGFAPVEQPQIAIAVVVEHGGRGGERAAPIAGDLMTRFFDLYGKEQRVRVVGGDDRRDAGRARYAVPVSLDPPDATRSREGPGEPDRRPRPFVERLGMAAIALVLAALFAVVAVAAFQGGEPFLGVMGAIGCLMVVWVGGLTLLRG